VLAYPLARYLRCRRNASISFGMRGGYSQKVPHDAIHWQLRPRAAGGDIPFMLHA
jgi:hypothetical protein